VGAAVSLAVAIFAAGAAEAQQAKFNPVQCDRRTASECNDLMGTFDMTPGERSSVLLARAEAKLQAHDLEGAIAELREITVIDPHNSASYGSLGIVESMGQHWPEAAADMRRALELDPKNVALRPVLAVAQAKGGDCSAAKETLAEARKTPDVPKLADAEATVGKACP
jgi:Flp pilus assembly protein TadD